MFNRLLVCGLFVLGVPSHSHACEERPTTARLEKHTEMQVGLDQILESLKQSTMGTRTFHETYYSHMLTTPSHKEGTLIFHPPSRLEKHVRVPAQESFIVNGDNLLYENPSREISRTFSLQEYPALAILIKGLRTLFSGDKEHLQQAFYISLSGIPENWELNLSPKTQIEEDGVNCIRLAGEDAYLRTIFIHETNGDHSELLLDPQIP